MTHHAFTHIGGIVYNFSFFLFYFYFYDLSYSHRCLFVYVYVSESQLYLITPVCNSLKVSFNHQTFKQIRAGFMEICTGCV